jgi:Na+-translocating ferredoxin:NAD+ oxidoreductase subunit B
MINELIAPVLTLGGMGLVFGAGLAYASKKFAVEVDPRIARIREIVPGANCGGCGYPGCDAFAVAVVEGRAQAQGCPVGGAACASNIAEIMGMEVDSAEPKVAKVICNGGKDKCKDKYEYHGIQDCTAANNLAGGDKGCKFGCLGLGTCVRACAFDAIKIENGIAKIIPEKCTGCGMCVKSCPKDVIIMAPVSKEVHVLCNSNDKGKDVKANCQVGCIGCQICVKNCPFDAFTFENNLAKIDYDKCTQCMVCVQKCPTKAIVAGH